MHYTVRSSTGYSSRLRSCNSSNRTEHHLQSSYRNSIWKASYQAIFNNRISCTTLNTDSTTNKVMMHSSTNADTPLKTKYARQNWKVQKAFYFHVTDVAASSRISSKFFTSTIFIVMLHYVLFKLIWKLHYVFSYLQRNMLWKQGQYCQLLMSNNLHYGAILRTAKNLFIACLGSLLLNINSSRLNVNSDKTWYTIFQCLKEDPDVRIIFQLNNTKIVLCGEHVL